MASQLDVRTTNSALNLVHAGVAPRMLEMRLTASIGPKTLYAEAHKLSGIYLVHTTIHYGVVHQVVTFEFLDGFTSDDHSAADVILGNVPSFVKWGQLREGT